MAKAMAIMPLIWSAKKASNAPTISSTDPNIAADFKGIKTTWDRSFGAFQLIELVVEYIVQHDSPSVE